MHRQPPHYTGLPAPINHRPPCRYSTFSGCGGAGAQELTTLELKNTISSQQTVCLDSIRLLGPGGGSVSGQRR